MDHSLNSLNNFDFLARSFARMHAEGRPVDILAVTGNMDEEHRTWFCALCLVLPTDDANQRT